MDPGTPRRALGRTGFVATALGAGDVADRALPKERCVATLVRALDAGLNVVDTAPNYEDGFSEEIVAEAVRGRRDRLFLVSKIDHLRAPVRPQAEASVARLQARPDAFVFHNVRTAADWEHVRAKGLAELEAAIDAGLTRFRGLSSHHPEVLLAALDDGRCDVLMFPVGPFVDARYVDEVLPRAKAQGVGTVCFKTFGAGKLLGDTSGYNQPLQQRPRGKRSSGGSDEAGTGAALPRLGVAECLHYTLTLDPDVALLGLSFPNEQDAAFAAARAFRPLDAAAMESVRARAAEAVRGKGDVWWNPAGPLA